MERIGIMEMQEMNKMNMARTFSEWKHDAVLILLNNDFTKPAPMGYVAVYLRSTPVKIVPVELVEEIKKLSYHGFMYDHMERKLICLLDADCMEGLTLCSDISKLLFSWIEKNIRNDG